jgi:hypothetical protein
VFLPFLAAPILFSIIAGSGSHANMPALSGRRGRSAKRIRRLNWRPPRVRPAHEISILGTS